MRIGTLRSTFILAVALVAMGLRVHAAERETQVPKPAAAVGFERRTFGPAVNVPGNWYKFDFFGAKPDAIAITRNPDGSVTIIGPGGNDYGAQLCTARFDAATGSWSGMAFGAGAFFELTMSFSRPYHGPGPAFWANDIETMHRRSANNRNIQWLDQPIGFGNWIETDIAEFNASGLAYGIAMHNWYGSATATKDINTHDLLGSPVTAPSGSDFAQPHRYGMLWVPATSGTQGYAKWYFDDLQLGKTVTWDQFNQSSPPPPIAGSSAFSVMDTRHLALILGTANNPVTIYAVSVWQKSAAHNLTSGSAHLSGD